MDKNSLERFVRSANSEDGSFRIGREPSVAEYLEAARKSGATVSDLAKTLKATGLEGPSRRLSRREQKLEREAKAGFNSNLEKQRPKGKPPAREWKVQTGKGGAFVLVHRESGDFYADYVVAPITSWGAKRFVTAADAYKHLNDPKFFNQGPRPQSSWNSTKSRADKVTERFRKRVGLR